MKLDRADPIRHHVFVGYGDDLPHGDIHIIAEGRIALQEVAAVEQVIVIVGVAVFWSLIISNGEISKVKPNIPSRALKITLCL